MHAFHLTGLLLAKLHQPILHIKGLLLFLLVRLLLLVETIQLRDPFFRLVLHAISHISLHNPILPTLTSSQIKQILHIVQCIMILLRMHLKALVLQIQVESLLPADETHLILVICYGLLLLS